MNENVELLINAALKAPSGDNCQPFRFKIENSNTILIRHLENRGHHFLNHANCASLLSLGAVLESLVVEAAGLGLQAEVELSASIGSATGSNWARVILEKSESNLEDKHLVGAFKKRWTCREPLFNEPLSEKTKLECAKEAAISTPDIKIYFGKPEDSEFLKFLKTCEVFLWKHPQGAVDFLKMIRFPGPDWDQAVDGLSIQELGVKSHEVMSLKLMRKYPSIIPVFYHLGLKLMAQQVFQRNYLQSSGYIVFTAHPEKSPCPMKTIVDVGRSVMRVWLSLSSQGYVAQPATLSTLLSYQLQHQLLHPDVLPEYQELYRKAPDLWKKCFSISDGEQVVWALRVGRPLPSSQVYTSRRQPISSVIES